MSPIMILVNSGAFSRWFSELTELIFVTIPYIYSTGYPPQNAKGYGYVQVANTHGSIMLPPRQLRVFARVGSLAISLASSLGWARWQLLILLKAILLITIKSNN